MTTAKTINERTIDITKSEMAIPFQFRLFAFEPTSSFKIIKNMSYIFINIFTHGLKFKT